MARLWSAAPSSPYQQPNSFIQQATLLADELPAFIRQALQRFRLHGNQDGALLFRGLPCDSVLPATPVNGQAAGKQSFGSEYCLATFAAHLGEIIGYRQEKHGALFHDMTPSAAQEHVQSSEGSRVQLEMHTERCFHPHLPDYLLLLCLRPDHTHQAATCYASVRRLRPLLSPSDYLALFAPEFRTGIDYSFGNLTTEKANGPVLSVLYGDPADPCMRYDLDLMEGLTARARSALAALTQLLPSITEQVCLDSGDLLVLDNRRVVHGRRAFSARYDGRDRWLQRVYVVSDLAASAADREPGSRVITTDFSGALPAAAGEAAG